MTETLHHFIGGAPVKGTSGRFGDVYNPALGAVARQVPLADTGEVGNAIAAAEAAWPAWAARCHWGGAAAPLSTAVTSIPQLPSNSRRIRRLLSLSSTTRTRVPRNASSSVGMCC